MLRPPETRHLDTHTHIHTHTHTHHYINFISKFLVTWQIRILSADRLLLVTCNQSHSAMEEMLSGDWRLKWVAASEPSSTFFKFICNLNELPVQIEC